MRSVMMRSLDRSPGPSTVNQAVKRLSNTHYMYDPRQGVEHLGRHVSCAALCCQILLQSFGSLQSYKPAKGVCL